MFSFGQKKPEEKPQNQPELPTIPEEEITTVDIFYEDVKKWLNSRRIIPQNALTIYKDLKTTIVKQFFEQHIFKESEDENEKILNEEIKSFFKNFESKLLESEDALPSDLSKTFSETFHCRYLFLVDLFNFLKNLQKNSKIPAKAQKSLSNKIEALRKIVEEFFENQKVVFIELPSELVKIVKYEIPSIGTSVASQNKKLEEVERAQNDLKKQISGLEKQWDSILIKEFGLDQNTQNSQNLKMDDFELNSDNFSRIKDFLSQKIEHLTSKLTNFWKNWIQILSLKNGSILEKSLDFYIDFMLSLQIFEEKRKKNLENSEKSEKDEFSEILSFFSKKREEEKQNNFKIINYLIKKFKEQPNSEFLSVFDCKLHFNEIPKENLEKIEKIAEKKKLNSEKNSEIEIVSEDQNSENPELEKLADFKSEYIFENDEIRKEFLLEIEELNSFYKNLIANSKDSANLTTPFQDLETQFFTSNLSDQKRKKEFFEKNELNLKILNFSEIVSEIDAQLFTPLHTASIGSPLFQNLIKIKTNKLFVDGKVEMLLQFKKTKERLNFEIHSKLEKERLKILSAIEKRGKKKEVLKQNVEKIVSVLEGKIKNEKLLAGKKINIYGMNLD